jgi:tetratricopeptide (TPR) repeat protein
MKRLLSVLPLAVAMGCNAPPTTSNQTAAGQAGAAAAGASQEPSLARAKQLMQEANYDEALLVTDAILQRNGKDHGARVLAAEANLALAEAGKGNVQAFLLDAVHNLEVAVEAKPDDAATLLRLADAHLKTSSFDKGRDAALAAANALRAQKANAAAIAGALIAAADNEMQVFVDARQPEIGREEPASEDTVVKAQAVLSRLSLARQGLPGKAAARTARVYQWLGQHESALAELERGIQADPTEPEVHVAFQDAMLQSGRRGDCVAAYKRIHKESGDQPTILFYLGRAQFSAADELRSRGQWDDAVKSYDEAKTSFGRYLALRPDHKQTATHWQAMCDLSRARIALDRGDHDKAKAIYYEAFATDPRVLAKSGEPVQIADSFGGTYAGGLFLLGTAIAEGSAQDSLRQALAFFEEVIAKHPDAIGQFYNNAGLAARDLGAAVAQSDEKAAMELWERSYRHYEKAVQLVPDDPRIVNDCGLMLVYHLKRDYDKARAMFGKAIELGEAQLDALDDASQDQRNFLEEAVGDAYQNLAVLARQEGKPFAAYKADLERAVKFYPGARRTAAELLRTQGGDVQGLPGSTGPALTPEARKQREAAAKGTEQAARFAPVAEAAHKAIAENDYDAALLALDGDARTLDGYAPYHALAGRCALAYAKEAQRNGGKLSQIDGLFADATTQLLRARELDGESSETRFLLMQALFETGKFDAARKEGASLLSHIRAAGQAGGVDLMAVHKLRAEASARVFIAAKQEEKDAPEAQGEAALREARESLRYLAENKKLDGKTLQTWMGLEQWAGAPGQALEVAAKAISDESAPADVLEQAVGLAAQLGQSDKVISALAGSNDATRQWYLGKASFTRAQELWVNDKAAAIKALDDGVAAFTAAKTAKADFADSSEQWTALCLGSKGVMLLGDNKLAEAEQALLAAIRLRPDVAGNDLGGGNSIKRGLLVLGGKYQRDLAKFEALMRAASDAAPKDVDFANNHGLAARDYGNQLERAGDTKQAAAMYEASYASYVRASELEPDNIRLRNDRALMLLYHLHRDLDDAVRTLEQARDDGLARIKDSPPATAQERQDLDEAVGDCIENLGYYFEHHRKDASKAIPHYKQSLEFHPKTQRAAARRLRALEGGGGK